MKKRPPKNATFPQDGPWLGDDLVVWRVRNNQPCAMCKQPLKKQRKDLASMQRSANRWFPTCLRCLHIEHLVFLPAGDSRVTRMASRLSSRRAVVMNTKYKTLHREGILVELAALRAACEKYDIELPAELEDTSTIQATANAPEPTVPSAPEPPRPTPQRTNRRDTQRNYRFFEAPAPVSETGPAPAPKPANKFDKPNKPGKVATTSTTPGSADNTFIQVLSERIRARYPRSPETMVDEIARFAIQVYLPKQAENAQMPAANDVDLGPLLTAFLRR